VVDRAPDQDDILWGNQSVTVWHRWFNIIWMNTAAMLLVALLCGWSARAFTLHTEEAANPIRKVVTLLQDMQKEIEAEGEKEKGLYDKFMCYCDGNADGMSNAAKAASQKIVELKSQLEAQTAQKSQLDQELVQHKIDREEASNDLATATAIREKEHSAYVADTGDARANVEALTGAIAALSKGMGNFLQLSRDHASRLRTIVESSQDVDSEDARDACLALLQGKQNPFGDYSAQSGEIVGMLKEMKDEMDRDLNGAVGNEEQAQAAFEEVKAAKEAAKAASGEAIEAKTKRSGELAVAIATTKDDIEDTTTDLNETQAFLANLGAACATKKQEWAERQKTRAEEIAAVSEAINVLNDDDALDLFKKTLSLEQGGKLGFLQKSSSKTAVRKARQVLSALAAGQQQRDTQLSLVLASLKAKKVDFSKVIGMIDGMAAQLGKEQKDDDAQKAFCEKDFAKSAKAKARQEEAIAQSEAELAEAKEASENLAAEMQTLQDEIKALDKAVSEATEQRKEEHADFVTYSTQNGAATQLIEKAKNRLHKFYKPNLYKPTPAPEAAVFAQLGAAPAPPPETWGAYEKKSGKSNGVIALMDMLLKEMADELSEAKHDEETAQSDYERLMQESQASRAKKAESVTSKEAAKADLDVKSEQTKERKASQQTELANTESYIAQLHGTCDFIVENYDLRAAARSNEIDSLKNAKAVLSGADFA